MDQTIIKNQTTPNLYGDDTTIQGELSELDNSWENGGCASASSQNPRNPPKRNEMTHPIPNPHEETKKESWGFPLHEGMKNPENRLVKRDDAVPSQSEKRPSKFYRGKSSKTNEREDQSSNNSSSQRGTLTSDGRNLTRVNGDRPNGILISNRNKLKVIWVKIVNGSSKFRAPTKKKFEKTHNELALDLGGP